MRDVAVEHLGLRNLQRENRENRAAAAEPGGNCGGDFRLVHMDLRDEWFWIPVVVVGRPPGQQRARRPQDLHGIGGICVSVAVVRAQTGVRHVGDLPFRGRAGAVKARAGDRSAHVELARVAAAGGDGAAVERLARIDAEGEAVAAVVRVFPDVQRPAAVRGVSYEYADVPRGVCPGERPGRERVVRHRRDAT